MSCCVRDPSAEDYCGYLEGVCTCSCHDGDYDADELGLDPEEDFDA